MRQHAESLDLERGEQLVVIQEVLNKKYLGKVRTKKLNNGVLSLTTPSAAVAGDLRLRQVQLIKQLKDYGVEGLKISISQ